MCWCQLPLCVKITSEASHIYYIHLGYKDIGCTENYFPSEKPTVYIYGYIFNSRVKVTCKLTILTTNWILTLADQLAVKHQTSAAEYTCNHAVVFMTSLWA